MNHRIAALGLLVAVLIAAPAGADIIVNPSNTPWIADSGDVINDGTLEIAHDATAEIRPGATVTLTGAITVGQRNNPGTLSQLVASGGTIVCAGFVASNKSEGDAYVELSGADVTVNSVTISSSVSELAGVNSTVVLSGGSLDITADTGILRIGATGSVNTTAPVIDWTQSGGDLTFMGKFIQIGTAPNVDATYTLSGGTFTQTRTGGWGLTVGGAAGEGYGTFHVDGYWDVAGVDHEIDLLGGGTRVDAQGTLKFTIHDANGTAVIHVAGVDAANMLGTVDIDLDGYTPANGETFTLMQGATDYGSLTLAAEDADFWTLSTDGDALRATYVEPNQAPVLVQGPGFTDPTVEPAGYGSGLGADAKCMALWDVVPHQDVDAPFGVGVVAFHMNGIDRVEFSLDNGPWTAVTEMTLNPRTNVWEYWVTLDPATIAAEGAVEIRAIAYPTDAGQPRLLEPMVLFVDKGTLPHPTLTITGTDIRAELIDYMAAGGSLEGLTIYLPEGDYKMVGTPFGHDYENERWVTVAPAPGADPANVRIVDKARSRIMYIRLHRLTLVHGDSYIWYPDRPGRSCWVDQCTAYSYDVDRAEGLLCQSADLWVTGLTTGGTMQGVYCRSDLRLCRDAHVSDVREDSFRLNGGALLVNCTSAYADAADTPRHPDIVQIYATDWENCIIYGLKAVEGIRAQGISPVQPHDMAVVNCVIQREEDSDAQMNLGTPINHYLIQNCTFNQRIVLRTTDVQNFVIRGTVLGNLGTYDGVTREQMNDWTFCSDLHLANVGSTDVIEDGAGTITVGDPLYVDPAAMDFRPADGSPLLDRMAPFVPVDITGTPRLDPTPIGAYEVAPATIPGDADGDGDVDLDDFVILKTNFGTPAGATQGEGDFDGDGDVDLDDFVILKTNFGT
ncbi:MAG: hypothetical protein ACOC95_07990 [Planctomycetota bacterium]